MKVEEFKTNFKIDYELLYKHFGQSFDEEQMILIRIHLLNMVEEQKRNEGQVLE